MNPSRWIALALLLFLAPLHGAEPQRFYYLAVPSFPAKCLFFTCVQLDSQGKILPTTKKKSPFFTLWRSGYWDEKIPDIVIKNFSDWDHALEVRARQAVAAKPEMSQLPPPIVEFFVALEKRRASALTPSLVVEPLFQSPDKYNGAYAFPGWENAPHLNVMVVPDTLGPKERSKKLMQSMSVVEKEQNQDLGDWMKKFLESLGQAQAMHVRWVRYYPEYNVFLFEAGTEFKETMELLFSATS